jgi:hypothetical protein
LSIRQFSLRIGAHAGGRPMRYDVEVSESDWRELFQGGKARKR